ncbi:MAG: ASCH domain-containing protein [Methanobrevibacter sp.]|uniref:ASCH domain-containing protein n=1 Tax=Methanobrevibacter sp. TaxID=66852 RepID=UPI0026DFAE14|nr:ASCH domain-containing protein [Methanobrevibacter sp.]MDO5849188.1 ASCH domain-containing protein [Methanobrevibacter sp.]
MKILKFNEKFYNPVIEGIKVATTRNRHKDLSAGDNIKLIFTNIDSLDGKLSLFAIVESVEKINYCDITSMHAESEGHRDVDSFKNSLKEFYPSLRYDSELYYIKFKLKEI